MKLLNVLIALNDRVLSSARSVIGASFRCFDRQLRAPWLCLLPATDTELREGSRKTRPALATLCDGLDTGTGRDAAVVVFVAVAARAGCYDRQFEMVALRLEIHSARRWE
jgi:hypothetical protein